MENVEVQVEQPFLLNQPQTFVQQIVLIHGQIKLQVMEHIIGRVLVRIEEVMLIVLQIRVFLL
jgi:hypothetical protein